MEKSELIAALNDIRLTAENSKGFSATNWIAALLVISHRLEILIADVNAETCEHPRNAGAYRVTKI
jgi:uncharacterized protein involved in high-affinity Fe2+ transport